MTFVIVMHVGCETALQQADSIDQSYKYYQTREPASPYPRIPYTETHPSIRATSKMSSKERIVSITP